MNAGWDLDVGAPGVSGKARLGGGGACAELR